MQKLADLSADIHAYRILCRKELNSYATLSLVKARHASCYAQV